MKTILVVTVCVFAIGCQKDKATPASACADAVTKGVDTMMAAGAKRMEASGGMPAEMKTKMDEAAVKLKQVITNRCTEDKWAADIIDCYSKATTRDELKTCRAKLPTEQSAKLQAEEMQVMAAMMGGGGMGGMGGMKGHPGALGGPPAGSGAAPTEGSGAGSGTGSAK